MRVEIYSDVVCPWCYIGERRFERALRAYGRGEEVEVVFRPYQLDPGMPASAVPLKEYLEMRYGPNASAMLRHAAVAAEAEGISIEWDRRGGSRGGRRGRLLGRLVRSADHNPRPIGVI